MQNLLLLHGALGSKDNFIELTKELSSDFNVYSLNFNGHGNQPLNQVEFSIDTFAKEVLLFLDQNKIESISIFGYSMGGYVALYLAKHFPERIKKVFTLATKLNWTIENSIQESKLLNATIIKEKVPKYAASLEQLHGNSWEKLMDKMAEFILDLGANPVLKEVDFTKITTPTLLAVGDKDVMVSIEETLNAYRKLSNSQFFVMPNTMHPIEKVNFKELAHQIKVFLAS
jgi:esterase/lipase